MPAFFVKNTDKGIVVSNKPLGKKEVTLNGKKRVMSIQQTDLKFGFFACENPAEIGYEAGNTVPVSLSTSPVLADSDKLFWCNPD